MASASLGRGSRAPIVGINVTPLVDVVLVLPKTATSDESTSRTYIVTIQKDGSLLFNDQPVSKDELTRRLQAAKAETKDVTLVVSADQAALHGQVVGVIDNAKVLGITKFAINVELK